MAVGLASDFTIYDELFHTAVTETLQQFTAFNAASGNTINIVPQRHMGDYRKYTLFDQVATTSRRDTTSVAGQTAANMANLEAVGVKINRKVNYMEHTIDAFKKIGMTSEVMSVILGEQTAVALMVDYMDSATRACVAAFDKAGSRTVPGATIDSTHLIDGLKLFGDRAGRLSSIVSTSALYYDLVKDQWAANILNVSDMNIKQGMPATLGRPVIVTDSAPLTDAGSSPDEYHTLMLVPGAVTIYQSEEATVLGRTVQGKENITFGWQYEYAFTLELKGYAWDVANGGANPADATVAIQTNWDQYASDVKDTAGILITNLQA